MAFTCDKTTKLNNMDPENNVDYVLSYWKKG